MSETVIRPAGRVAPPAGLRVYTNVTAETASEFWTRRVSSAA